MITTESSTQEAIDTSQYFVMNILLQNNYMPMVANGANTSHVKALQICSSISNELTKSE